MKKLIIILLLFIGVKGIGQKRDTIAIEKGLLINGGEFAKVIDDTVIFVNYRANPNIILDTVRVLMLLCDTSYEETLQHSFPVDSGNGEWTTADRNDKIWWQLGYEVFESVSGWTTNENTRRVIYKLGQTYEHKEYLTEDKKPMPSFIYVWMANEINASVVGEASHCFDKQFDFSILNDTIEKASLDFGILNNKETCDGIIFSDSPSSGIAIFGTDTGNCCKNVLYTKDLCDKCKQKIKDFEKLSPRQKRKAAKEHGIKITLREPTKKELDDIEKAMNK